MLAKSGRLLPSVLLLALNLFLFIPFTIYSGNLNEFAVPLPSILGSFFLPALLIFIVVAVPGLILPGAVHRRYAALVLGAAVSVWAQGNFLVWDYGLFGVEGVDFSSGWWRGAADIALWAAVLGASLIFFRRVYESASLLAVALIALQSLYLGYSSFERPEIWKDRHLEAAASRPPDDLYAFSTGENIIHVLLDAFQSDIFLEIINGDRERYHDALEGFTFFREANSAYPYTNLSIPSILSGEVYMNRTPKEEYIERTLDGGSIRDLLYEKGYRVDVASPVLRHRRGRYTNYYYIPKPYGLTGKERRLSEAYLLLDMSLFRGAPHHLKRLVYNDQRWLFQPLAAEDDHGSYYHFASRGFFRDFIDNMNVSTGQPVYKFIHLLMTHGPFVLAPDCGFSGGVLERTRHNVKVQDSCSLELFIEFLERLKAMGIYESSLIIVNADHGTGNEVEMAGLDASSIDGLPAIAGTAMALMAVKPPGAKGPLRVSGAEVSVTDIPATINSIAGLGGEFEGVPVFEQAEGEARTREFYYYVWYPGIEEEEYFSHLQRFTISGKISDAGAWAEEAPLHSPGSTYLAKAVDFGAPEARRFYKLGWGGDAVNGSTGHRYKWARGRSASIFLSLPREGDVLMTLNVNTEMIRRPQTVSVVLDGNDIGTVDLLPGQGAREASFLVPWGALSRSVSVVEFRFSEPQGREGETPVAVLFDTLKVGPARH